ncbi:hypothetical protein CkaCkLH20_10396 [Colletotrichum karsti]|uniref:Heterokaryon incompatibility protein 6, OR allele n=1 Tax=Colletotrichum karsti TaxID=1095194 RepID=A0A9P6HWZ4_9PEZI|nr:uncharacterized protein CkaCkLH20_10396 [Colletotrichum karsti]KAF9872059.1 hypothetical protein CkaCkLH20_10396 [Colletotrichum karsti]
MKASEPRDKIYAMRSQLTDTFGRMDVDYNQPIESVFATATRYMLMQSNGLESLYHASRPTKLGNLPSWAIDWASEEDMEYFWYHSLPWMERRVCGGSEPLYRFSVDGRALYLRGRLVGKVHDRYVSPVCPCCSDSRGTAKYDTFSDQKVVSVILKEAAAWFSDLTAAANAAPGTIDPALTVPQSTLSSVASLLDFIRSQSFERIRKKFVSSFQLTPKNDLKKMVSKIASDRMFSRKFAAYLGTGRLFLTAKGSFGCALRSIEPGDLLCIFSGLPYPFAVRPSGSSYILVGPVLLDGVMEGEMWPEDESVLEEWEFV